MLHLNQCCRASITTIECPTHNDKKMPQNKKMHPCYKKNCFYKKIKKKKKKKKRLKCNMYDIDILGEKSDQT